jgi:hypothetical protein
MNRPAEVEAFVLGRAVASSGRDRALSCIAQVKERYHQLTKGALVHE